MANRDYIWIGIATFNNSMGENVIALADDEQLAKVLLLNKWRQAVGREFQADIATWNQLAEWNGASVKCVQMNTAHIWEQL